MAYDVAVIRCIVVALGRNMSRPWLIEKIQILVWHKYLHCSLIDDLTINLYGYRIRYLVESNCEAFRLKTPPVSSLLSSHKEADFSLPENPVPESQPLAEVSPYRRQNEFFLSVH